MSRFWPRWWISILLAAICTLWLMLAWNFLWQDAWESFLVHCLIAVPVIRWLPNTIAIKDGAVVKYRWLGLWNRRIPIDDVSCFRVGTRVEMQKAGVVFPLFGHWLHYVHWMGSIAYGIADNELVVWLPSARDGRYILFSGFHGGRERFLGELQSLGVPEWGDAIKTDPPAETSGSRIGASETASRFSGGSRRGLAT